VDRDELYDEFLREIEYLQSELKLYLSVIRYQEEEIQEFKNTVTLLLGKLNFEVDKVTPEDLQYEIIQREGQRISLLFTVEEITALCFSLGMTVPAGLDNLTVLKIFIKELARKNSQLEKLLHY
jgi:hypothetical protein